MSLVVMTVHCRFGGCPLMGSTLNELPGYFAQFPDLWFARHRELAQWTLDREHDELTHVRRFFGCWRGFRIQARH